MQTPHFYFSYTEVIRREKCGNRLANDSLLGHHRLHFAFSLRMKSHIYTTLRDTIMIDLAPHYEV